MKTITKKQKQVFEYLNDLRDCGVVNMFGARIYIEDEFEMDKKEAGEYLSLWMKNFNKDGYDDIEVVG